MYPEILQLFILTSPVEAPIKNVMTHLMISILLRDWNKKIILTFKKDRCDFSWHKYNIKAKFETWTLKQSSYS